MTSLQYRLEALTETTESLQIEAADAGCDSQAEALQEVLEQLNALNFDEPSEEGLEE